MKTAGATQKPRDRAFTIAFSPSCYHHVRDAVRLLLSRPFVCSCSLLVWLLLAFFPCAAQSTSQESVSLDDALHELVDRISAIPNFHGPCRLQFLQDSNLAAETAKDWQQSLRKELESRRVSVTEDPAAPVLRIGVAETPTQVVLSASARVAEKDEVRLVTVSRTSFRTASLPVAPVRLEKQLVYQGPERLLDASSLWSGASPGLALLVDREGELEVLRVDSAGAIQQSVSLNATGALLSRDPRAELSVQAEAISVLLPGKSCQFTWAAPAEAKCHVVKPYWRGPTVLTPSCDPGGWKLQADGSDWTAPDLLQALPENSMQKGSAAILSDFPGPILSINGEQSPSSALVVMRNLRTGNYEVYKLTLACGN